MKRRDCRNNDVRTITLLDAKTANIQHAGQELADKEVGRPNVGGPLSLTTHDGKPFTEQDLLGRWSLIYFGFTNCPDICPDELDKMSAAVDTLGECLHAWTYAVSVSFVVQTRHMAP